MKPSITDRGVTPPLPQGARAGLSGNAQQATLETLKYQARPVATPIRQPATFRRHTEPRRNFCTIA